MQKELLRTNVVSKSDDSPVTVIDFAVQVAISYYLFKTFRDVPFRC